MLVHEGLRGGILQPAFPAKKGSDPFFRQGIRNYRKKGSDPLSQAVQPPVMRAENDAAVRHSRRRGNCRARVELPHLCALYQVQLIEPSVGRPDKHAVPYNSW